jgi:hypothetical protein
MSAPVPVLTWPKRSEPGPQHGVTVEILASLKIPDPSVMKWNLLSQLQAKPTKIEHMPSGIKSLFYLLFWLAPVMMEFQTGS